MSILNGPRLNFWGGIRTDVSVPNNSPTLNSPTLNGGKPFPIFDIATSTVATEAQTYSDAELNNMINTPAGDYYTAGGWNHYGQHVVDMQNALISSQGEPGSISTSGDMVGQPVYLLGSVDPVTGQGPFSGPMMVDLDPTSSITTQIYVGGLQIGGNQDPQLLIRSDTVCSSFDVAQRLLAGETDAPGSSLASGTFQVTFPLSSIVSYNKNSAMLKSIIEAPGATGIVLRFVMFEMCPAMTTKQLDADYAAAKYTPNPSIGRVIGTLAPAFAGEPTICPAGRQLLNQGTGGAGYAGIINDGMLSIDMVNIIPKDGFRKVRDDITSPIGPNVNYGNVTVAACSTTLAVLDPTSPELLDYYVYGGIVDISLKGADQLKAAQTNPLSITAPNEVSDTTLNAPEQPYRVYSDQRNIYLDDYPGGADIALQVRYLGGPVPTPTQIALSASPPGTYVEPKYWNFIDAPATLCVPAGGTSVTFKASAKQGTEAQAGYSTLTCTANGGSSFTNFRTYAQTDFGIPSGTVVSWEQAYQNVLRFHYLAFPAMSRFIPLNEEDAIVNAKNAILARTSERYKGTTLYMPVVRSMSPSQRALLSAFLTGTPWDPTAR